MDTSARAEAFSGLSALATSTDYRDRADAGVALVQFLDVEGATSVVTSLVLDENDTSVTNETTGALVRRDDEVAWALLAKAQPAADEDTANWIDTAIETNVFYQDLARPLAVCRRLLTDADPQVRLGASYLVDLITSLRDDQGR